MLLSPKPVSQSPAHPTSAGSSKPRFANLSLRPRQPEDLKPLFDLFCQADFQRNASTLDPVTSLEGMAGYIGRQGPGVFEMVAVLEDLIVGFAGLYVFGGRQRHTGSCTLAVHESFQARGIGSTLLSALLATAHGFIGLRRVQLTVFVDNVRAISLYEKFGFQTEGRLRDFVLRDDGYIDALVMAWQAPETPLRS